MARNELEEWRYKDSEPSDAETISFGNGTLQLLAEMQDDEDDVRFSLDNLDDDDD